MVVLLCVAPGNGTQPATLAVGSQAGAGNVGFGAQPRAAGGEDSAHLAHRGAQAPGDLHAMVVHQKGRDVLPVVALRHPDSGDGGKSGLLRKIKTGFNPTALGDPQHAARGEHH